MSNQSSVNENNNLKIEQSGFCLFPKELFTDDKYKNISNDAKLLYTLMLDRVSLSAKNDWVDSNGCVYIYFTLEEVQNTLNCGRNKGVKIMAELDEVELITRVKQGLGKPAKIYVKKLIESSDESNNLAPDNSDSSTPDNSVVSDDSTPSTETASPNNLQQSKQEVLENSMPTTTNVSEIEVRTENYPQTYKQVCPQAEKEETSQSYPQEYSQGYQHNYPQGSQDFPKEEADKFENKTYVPPDTKPTDFPKGDGNNTDFSHTDFNNTKINKTDINTHPIQSYLKEKDKHKYELDKDGIGERNTYKSLIKNSIEYELLIKQYGLERVDELLELMLDVVCSKEDYITIARNEYPKEIVKNRFLKLNYMHIHYAFNCLDKNITKVRNSKKYLIATLYNSFITTTIVKRKDFSLDG